MLNIVVDTNQYLSAFLYNGMMQTVFDLVIEKKLHLYVSPALKDEVREKLELHGASEQIQRGVLIFMEKRGVNIEPTIKVSVCRDPEDNFALELSEAAGVDYLITRDKDLLDMQHWKQTKIIKPEDFLPLLRKMQLLD